MSHRTLAQDRLARVIPSMHVHLCVALWLFSLHPSPSSTSFRRSPSGPSRCSPQSSTRGPGPNPCATSAWGPWPLLTTRHPLTPNAPKFEDRSREERVARVRCPAKQRGSWPKMCSKLKEHERAAFFSSPENRCHLASSLKPEE